MKGVIHVQENIYAGDNGFPGTLFFTTINAYAGEVEVRGGHQFL